MDSQKYNQVNTFRINDFEEVVAGPGGFLLRTADSVWFVNDDQHVRVPGQARDMAMGARPLLLRQSDLAQVNSTGGIARGNEDFSHADDVTCVLDTDTTVVRTGEQLHFCDTETLLQHDTQSTQAWLEAEHVYDTIGGFEAFALVGETVAAWVPIEPDFSVAGFRVSFDTSINDVAFLGDYFVVSWGEYLTAYEPERGGKEWTASLVWETPIQTNWLTNRCHEQLLVGTDDGPAFVSRDDGSVNRNIDQGLISTTPRHSRLLSRDGNEYAVSRKSSLRSLSIDVPDEVEAHTSMTGTVTVTNQDETSWSGSVSFDVASGELSVQPGSDQLCLDEANGSESAESVRCYLDPGESSEIQFEYICSESGSQTIQVNTPSATDAGTVNIIPTRPSLAVDFTSPRTDPGKNRYVVDVEILNSNSVPVKSKHDVYLDDTRVFSINKLEGEYETTEEAPLPPNIGERPEVIVRDIERDEVVFRKETVLELPQVDFQIECTPERITTQGADLSITTTNTGEAPLREIEVEATLGDSRESVAVEESSASTSSENVLAEDEVVEPDASASSSTTVSYVPDASVTITVTATDGCTDARIHETITLPSKPLSCEFSRQDNDSPGVSVSLTPTVCAVETTVCVSVPEFDLEQCVETDLDVEDTHEITLLFPNPPTRPFDVNISTLGLNTTFETEIPNYPPIVVDRTIEPVARSSTDLNDPHVSPRYACNELLVDEITVKNIGDQVHDSIALHRSDCDHPVCEHTEEFSSGDMIRFTRETVIPDGDTEPATYTITASGDSYPVPTPDNPRRHSDISVTASLANESQEPKLTVSLQNSSEYPVSVSGISFGSIPILWPIDDVDVLVESDEHTKWHIPLDTASPSDVQVTSLISECTPVPLRVDLALHVTNPSLFWGTYPISLATLVKPAVQFDSRKPPIDISYCRNHRGRSTSLRHSLNGASYHVSLEISNELPADPTLKFIELRSRELQGTITQSVQSTHKIIDIRDAPTSFSITLVFDSVVGEIVLEYDIKRTTGIMSSWEVNRNSVRLPTGLSKDSALGTDWTCFDTRDRTD